MMKNYTIAALAAAPCVVAVAPAATVEEYTAVMKEQIALAEELTDVLTSIVDKDSADAAAAKMAVIMEKGEAIKAKEDALGEPSPEMEKALELVREEWIYALVQFSMTSDTAMKRIVENDCYGSEALKTLLFAELESTQTIKAEAE